MNGNGTINWSIAFISAYHMKGNYHWTHVEIYLYVILGGMATVTNFVLTVVIWRHAALRRRKEYIVIGGLSFADFIEGFATLLAGIFRLVMINHGWASTLVSVLTCLALPSHILWRWSDIATSFMLLAVSCDRLFAVSKPLVYYQRGPSYAIKTVLIVYLTACLGWLFVWHPIKNPHIMVSALCKSTAITSPIFYQFSKYTTSLSSAFSVIIYVIVVLILQRRTRALRHCTDSITLRRQTQVQRKLTVTLGISSFLTLLLDAIPRAVGMHLYLKDNVNLFLLIKLNAIANVFIFSLRQPEIRHGMLYMLSCSQLPEDINLWDVSSRMGSNPRINPNRIYRRRRKCGFGCVPPIREGYELKPLTANYRFQDVSRSRKREVVSCHVTGNSIQNMSIVAEHSFH